jgi:hypothetical protein
MICSFARAVVLVDLEASLTLGGFQVHLTGYRSSRSISITIRLALTAIASITFFVFCFPR